jgi:membrane peptidoglycan carboxypeptidase
MARSARVGPVPPLPPNGSHHRRSYAARLAASRSTTRHAAARGGGVLASLLVSLVLVIVVVTGVGVVGVGGAAGIALAELERDLPAVETFDELGFAQPTTIWDRDGKTMLARFWEQRRKVIAFDDIPRVVLDATTAVEDESFWENPGVDLQATLAALAADVASSGERGGGSTITQQLVRARLLPRQLMASSANIYERKAKEIIQAFKLTQAFPGESGKRRIITAYLNQIFYGKNAYGIAAAADVFFRKPLDKLSVAEVALLTGLPQSPVLLDPYKYAKKIKKGKNKGKFQVPTCGSSPEPGCRDVPPVVRRNYILGRMAAGKGRWTQLSQAELKAALDEPIILANDRPLKFKAPHFVWAMRAELDFILADRDPVTRGGYRVITTIDMKAQKLAERLITGAARVPQLGLADFSSAIRKFKLSRDRRWIANLRGANVRNAAMAAIDYRTGDILAYVGSVGYYRRSTKRVDPKYDHVGQGRRQPGSAWKPVVYASGIEERAITAGSVLLDVTTPFARGWIPRNADSLERGPVLVRKALQYSLNIPAIRALHRIGPATVAKYARKAGMTFLRGPKHLEQAGLAGAIGTVEVRLIDLLSAYGALGNGGVLSPPRSILRVLGPDGSVIYEAGDPVGREIWSPQTAFIMSDILKGNTNPRDNSIWGPRFALRNGPGGSYRPAAMKTGTTNDNRDYSTYGYLAPPRNRNQPAVAVGVWMGNSDHSAPNLSRILYASDGPAQVWKAFMRDYMRGKPVADFSPPRRGLVRQPIDAYSGGRPGSWTRQTVNEWFIVGTQPSRRDAVDKPGLIYSGSCGGSVINLLAAENRGAPASWRSAVRDWMSRARSGPYVRSRWGTRTAYFFGRSSWGGVIGSPDGGCPAPPTAPPTSAPETATPPRRGGGGPAPTCRPGSTNRSRGCVVATPEPAQARGGGNRGRGGGNQGRGGGNQG